MCSRERSKKNFPCKDDLGKFSLTYNHIKSLTTYFFKVKTLFIFFLYKTLFIQVSSTEFQKINPYKLIID